MIQRLLATFVVAGGLLSALAVLTVHLNDRVNWRSYYRGLEQFGDQCAVDVVPWTGDFAAALAAAQHFRPFPMPHRGAEPPLRVYPQEALVTRCVVPRKALGQGGYLRLSLGILYGPSAVYVNGREVQDIDHHEEVLVPVTSADVQASLTLAVVSRGTADGLAGMATLAPPYATGDLGQAHLVDHFLHSWNGEQPALVIGVAAVVMIFLMILWLSGFNYSDVGWNLVQAGSLCVVQVAVYARQFAANPAWLLRVEAGANAVLAAAVVMFVVTFLRPAREALWNRAAAAAAATLLLFVVSVPASLFLQLKLLSQTQSYLQGAALAVFLSAAPFLARGGDGGDQRRRRRRLILAVGWIAAAVSLLQAVLETRYGLLVTPLTQMGTMIVFSSFLLQDLLASQRRYMIEREARLAKEHEAATARAVAQLAQMASHDIKRPFRIVKVLEQLLRKVSTQAETAELLKAFVPQLTRVEAQIQGTFDDIFEAQAEKDQRPSASASVLSPSRLLSQTVEIVALTLEGAKGPELRYELTDRRLWLASEVKILRVLQNLLENAVKATPPGGSIVLRSDAADEHFCQFSVQNSGSFIPAERIAEIFKIGVSERGSGFGLAAAKRIVEAHGGVLSCTSESEQGTTFTFTVPVAPGGERDAADTALPASFPEDALETLRLSPSARRPASLPRLAVVDDDPVVELGWRSAVRDAELEFFRDPAMFLRTLQGELGQAPSYQAVVIDYFYKGSAMNGPALAEAIAALPGQTPPILMMSEKRLRTGDLPQGVVIFEQKTPLPWSVLKDRLG